MRACSLPICFCIIFIRSFVFIRLLRMHSFTSMLVLGALTSQAFGTVHHLFWGVFSGADIYAIEFDDETNALTLVNNVTTNATSSKWIAIDVCGHSRLPRTLANKRQRNGSKTFMLGIMLSMIAIPSLAARIWNMLELWREEEVVCFRS